MLPPSTNDFRLFAHGVNFDPDAYLASTTLEFDGVWHKGESGHDHPKTSGVFKELGNGRKIDVDEQDRLAIEYLSSNYEEIRALAKYPGVKTIILGLQFCMVLYPATIGFCIGPSALLMWHALRATVDIQFYVSLDRHLEWESDPDDDQACP